MKVTIAYNTAKNGIELFFMGDFPEGLVFFLKEVGFKESLSNAKKWYVDNHTAYKAFANSLKEILAKGEDWQSIKLSPSFTSSLENIEKSKFSLITIHYRGKEKAAQQDYVLFDSYKKVAKEIATRFALDTYGEDFKDLEVFPRNYKRKARLLFKEGKIIDGSLTKENQDTKQTNPSKEEVPEAEEITTEIVAADEISILRSTLQEVIGELLTLEETLAGEAETIIGTTLFDLEEALEEQDETKFQNLLKNSTRLFRDWAYDLDDSARIIALKSINKLIQLMGGSKIPTEKEKEVGLSVPKDIFNRDHIVPNVLVPSQAGEPFQSGGLTIVDGDFLKKKFPQLYKITDDNLSEVSGLALFQLSQMAHPTDYGLSVYRSSVLSEWENRGPETFEEIGYPTDLDYPYVNIHTGYKSVSTLGSEIGAYDDRHQWWSVVEHSRPIADLAKGIVIMDELLTEQVEKRIELINPKTNKPKTDKKSKETFNDIKWKISRLEKSKQVIQDYINKGLEAEDTLPKLKSKKEKKQASNDYLDKVIALMHTAFANAERLSKKKIENLKEKTGAPTLGALWEAVELSWLLWYKMLYKEPIPFEARLKKMIQFWDTVQPTYAYSDSSKELYKQYSTSCPIGAIIAQYTRMDEAEFIFEPSAGNGLLLVGANPRITHVNEIDKSRRESLKHQGFGRITSENAAEPFPEMMHKVHDVVVTNPPFASWDDSKFDKERIIQKYFNKHRGLENHIRLEHLMAGLALYTMTDDGKAAIIIMGHVYYGDDGLFAKYRPFFNWLYRHYKVDDIINMNSYKLYNKQGAVTKTMLILIGGRKSEPSGVAPNKSEQPHLETLEETFEDLWERTKDHIRLNIETIITQLKTARIK